MWRVAGGARARPQRALSLLEGRSASVGQAQGTHRASPTAFSSRLRTPGPLCRQVQCDDPVVFCRQARPYLGRQRERAAERSLWEDVGTLRRHSSPTLSATVAAMLVAVAAGATAMDTGIVVAMIRHMRWPLPLRAVAGPHSAGCRSKVAPSTSSASCLLSMAVWSSLALLLMVP